MKKPALVAFDVDHTAVECGDLIPPLTRKALDRLHADGIPYVPVTGRPIPSALRFARLTHAPYVVALGGAAVVEVAGGDVVWCGETITADQVAQMWAQALQADAKRAARLHAHTLDAWFVTIADRTTERYRDRHDLSDPHHDQPPGPVLLVENLGLPLVRLPEGLTGHGAREETSTFVDITAPGVSKATGVEQVCRLLGHDWDEVVTFGDSPNDVPMFERAAAAVAVGDVPRLLLADASHHMPLSAAEGGLGAAVLALVYRDDAHVRRMARL
jgi:hydroxymethylpyrimidine pyrophosphatase-like HAD family hydrolase